MTCPGVEVVWEGQATEFVGPEQNKNVGLLVKKLEDFQGSKSRALIQMWGPSECRTLWDYRSYIHEVVLGGVSPGARQIRRSLWVGQGD